MAWRTSLVSVVPWGSSQNVTLDLHIDPAVDAVSPNHKKLLKIEIGAGGPRQQLMAALSEYDHADADNLCRHSHGELVMTVPS
jgi:hypothetical protein